MTRPCQLSGMATTLHHAAWSDPEIEAEADYVAACLVVPRRALRSALSQIGPDFEVLAELFRATQTCVALRLGEDGLVSASAVVTPARIYARSQVSFELPAEPALRRIAQGGMPGIKSVRLTDDQRRITLLAEDELLTA